MRPEDAESAWQELMAGNTRFAEGAPLHPRQAPDLRAELAGGQRPFAAVVGCSDSRVPAEIIFDCGLGDLFVVRTAGQVLTEAGYASLEFAVTALDVPLIVVLGHSNCGAVRAALEGAEAPGYLGDLLVMLCPVAEAALVHEDPLGAAIEDNVRQGMERLRTLDPVLGQFVAQGRVVIRGAVYDLESGRVREVLHGAHQRRLT